MMGGPRRVLMRTDRKRKDMGAGERTVCTLHTSGRQTCTCSRHRTHLAGLPRPHTAHPSAPHPFLFSSSLHLTVSRPSSRHGCSTSILIFSLTLPGVCQRVRGPIKSCKHPICPGPSTPPPFPVSVPAWRSEESDPVRTLVGQRFELFHLLLG